ncbi:MAG TPA: hypothetical protein VFJ12_16540 [Segeticoccus sp.]|jgi:hypothetical protein|nr:hypothetical protein [Segeticoccus sp.]
MPPAGAGRLDVPRPPSITGAVQLMWAGAALSLIGWFVSLATLGRVRGQLSAQAPLLPSSRQLTPEQIDLVVDLAVWIGAASGLVTVLLWVWMAAVNRKGRGWARVLATLFGCCYLLSVLSGLLLGRATGGADLVLPLATAVVGLFALVLLWRRESSDYIRSARWRR